jgi:hypothetical protein
VDGLDGPQMVLERRLDGRRQHGHMVFRALAVSDEDLVPGEVTILDAQPQAFQQLQPGAVHHGGHHPLVAGPAFEDGSDLIPCHDDGEAPGLPGPYDVPQVSDLAAEVEE